MARFWTANLLLRCLPEPILAELKDRFEPAEITVGQVLFQAGDTVKDYYFIDRGLVSLVIGMSDGRAVEVGAVGIEGFPGSTSFYANASAATDVVVQIPGTAFLMSSEALHESIARHSDFRELVQRYSRFKIVQIAQTAACNRLHSLEHRCVSKILIAQDNARSDTFQITHDYLAHFLGTQRAAVTTTLSRMKCDGMLDYRRGALTILDRAALEQRSCECYATIRRDIDELFKAARPY